MCRGIEIETRPSRLGLARVSIVRGQGPLTGEACIDDYIRVTEPVFDYLTKWSGLVSQLLSFAPFQHSCTFGVDTDFILLIGFKSF